MFSAGQNWSTEKEKVTNNFFVQLIPERPGSLEYLFYEIPAILKYYILKEDV